MARALSLLLAAGVSTSGCSAHCLAACVGTSVVTAVDGSGNPVALTGGTAVLGEGTPLEFSCDGAVYDSVSCTGSEVKVAISPGLDLRLTLRDASGQRFSGEVPLQFTAEGQNVCESDCMVARPTLTVQ